MTIAEDIAEFVRSRESVPSRVSEHARSAIFDLLTAAIAGFGTLGAAAARTAARASWGPGVAPIWFAGERLSVPGAAFANSAAASMLDLDDGHRAAAGHPGASIIPAVFATAAAYETAPERMLTAIALGYEVAVRIAASRDYAALTTMVSGPWVGQGAAAASAWLRGLAPAELSQAIAIAGASAPNLAAIAYSRVMGNHLKEGIPWATATGLAAVDLAAAGFTGPTDLLDNAELFNRDTLVDGLGTSWAIEGIYFKPYSCCRWAHAAIDAVLTIKARHRLDPSKIDAVRIETFGWALRLNNETAPATLESAQYSVPFCVAVGLVRGPEALLRLTEEALSDTEAIALAKRVSLSVDPEFDRMFPTGVPARVTTMVGGRSFTETVVAPLGEPSNPLDWSALHRKFRGVTSPLLTPGIAGRIDEAVAALGRGEIEPILATLSARLDMTPSG